MSFHKIEEPPVLALFSSITRAKMQGAPRTNTSRNVLTPFGLNRVRRNDLRKGSTQRKVRGTGTKPFSLMSRGEEIGPHLQVGKVERDRGAT